MMELAICPRCGSKYLPGQDKFCTNCGLDLADVERRRTPAGSKRYRTRPYGTLRFLASAIEYVGIVLILLTWFAVLMWWTSVNAIVQKNGSNVSDPIVPILLRSIPGVVAVSGGLVGTVIGMIVVAWGQVIKVFLDIRDDIKSTMRLTRSRNMMLLNNEEEKA